MTTVDLTALLGNLDEDVKTELASTPEVVDKGDDLNVDELPVVARRWHKLNDVVAVVADLKNSTKVGRLDGQHLPGQYRWRGAGVRPVRCGLPGDPG